MKGTIKGDDVLPLGVISRQLERAFRGFGSGVAVVELVRAGHGRDLRQTLGQRDQALVIKIGARHVDELRRLLLNGGHHLGMAVAGGSHGDAGGEIEELVAVDIGDDEAMTTLCH